MNKDYFKHGYFGNQFGGQYVPELLLPALKDLEEAYLDIKNDVTFQRNFQRLLKDYVGRPSPLYYAENLTKYFKKAKIYLKNEGLNHTGAHKINNALGQALLAKEMNKSQIIAETGAGQHGIATASVAAKLSMPCKVFMGEIDVERQQPNVLFMKLMNSEVISVKENTKTLLDAVNATLKYWIEHLENTYYIIGSALGPHPYPMIVRDFQSIIGKEIKEQVNLLENGKLPKAIIACVGGGSNALGAFSSFINEKNIQLIGVEAGGKKQQTWRTRSKIVKS